MSRKGYIEYGEDLTYKASLYINNVFTGECKFKYITEARMWLISKGCVDYRFIK